MRIDSETVDGTVVVSDEQDASGVIDVHGGGGAVDGGFVGDAACAEVDHLVMKQGQGLRRG